MTTKRSPLYATANAPRGAVFWLRGFRQGTMAKLFQMVRDFWLAATRQKQSNRGNATPEVIIHDPGAQRPHDLDDPYFDPKVQSRMADVIAKNAAKKN